MNSATQTNSARHAATVSRSAASRVQAKLRVNRAQDSYEQEADRAAHAVVGGNGPSRASAAAVGTQRLSESGPVTAHLAPTISRLPSHSPVPSSESRQKEPQESVQPQAEENEVQANAESRGHEEKHQEEKNKERPQKKVQLQLDKTPQAKDDIDHEAQGKADHPESQKDSKRKDEDRVQRAPDEDKEPQARLHGQESEKEEPQRKGDEETDVQGKLQLQEEEEAQAREEPLSAGSHNRVAGPPPLATKLFETKGRGEPLPPDTATEMETGFQADFSAVRIHTSATAVDMSRGLRAQALTHGRDIFFNTGKYDPQTQRGKALLAHELTHVIQQQAAPQAGAPFRAVTAGNANSKPEKNPGQQENTGHATTVASPAIRSAGVFARTSPSEVSGGSSPRRQVEQSGRESAKQSGTAPGPRSSGTGAVEGPATQGTKGPEPRAPGKAVTASKSQTADGTPAETALGALASPQAAPGLDVGKTRTPAAAATGEFLRRSTQTVFNQRRAAIHEVAQAHTRKHSAQEKLAEAEKAVQPPALEAQSRANATQVETVAESPAPEPDDRQAKASFDQALNHAVPKTLEEVDNFKDAGRGQIVGQMASQAVTAETQEVKSAYRQVENAPHAGTPDDEFEDMPEVEPTPATPAAATGEGVVGEVPAEHSDLSEFGQKSDEFLAKEQIKEEHLEMVDEGDLAEARQNRQEVKGKVRTGPAEVKQVEREEKQKVSQDLSKEEQQGKQAMQLERRQELHGARDGQKKTKTRFELQRQAVTDRINGIYEKANSAVKQRLDDLEKKSLAAFDQGQKQATTAFENNVKTRMNAFKSRRYGGAGGGLLWAKDKLFGMDDLPEVKEVFESEKLHFVIGVNELIRQITADSKRVVQECRDIVAGARREIDKLIQGLGPELRKAGAEALKNIRANLDALDDKIKAKEEELKQKLAAKREAAIKAIEDKIAKMKEEMSGLVSKLGRLLLDAMVKFFKWALKKAGYASDQLMGILNKGKEVIQKIVSDPISFIKNLVKAVRDGIDLFSTNIRKHLMAGLMNWLTGAMSDVPITFPDKWDLKGVLYFVLQILGLTWDNIRAKLVKRLGEKVVRIAETSVDILKRLVTEGPIALWEMLKEKAAEIKEQVVEGIRNWATFELVKQGIIKLVSFLNPAGAIVQAILAIYNTVMFFVENWERIVQFVKTVFSSVGDIAMGKLSAAAAAVENALGMTVTIILTFLARLLGLSGIGKAVSAILKKIRKPIDKVVNKVVDVVARLATKLVAKVKAGAKTLKEKGLALIQWWKKKLGFKSKDGGSHKLFYREQGSSARLMIASQEKTFGDFLRDEKADGALVKKHEAVQKTQKELQNLEAQRSKASAEQKKKLATPINQANSAHTDALSELSKSLEGMNFETKTDLAIKTFVKFTPGVVEAKPLTWLPGNTKGAPPGSTAILGWSHVTKIDPESKVWVRGHMLNEKLHGPAEPSNLVPINKTVNRAMESGPESWAKSRVAKQGTVLRYKTTVTRFWSEKPKPINHFPHKMKVEAAVLTPVRKEGKLAYPKDQETEKGGPWEFEQNVPEAGETPDINDLGSKLLVELTKISRRFEVDYYKDARKAKKFETFSDLEQAITGRNNASPAVLHNLERIRAAEQEGSIRFPKSKPAPRK